MAVLVGSQRALSADRRLLYFTSATSTQPPPTAPRSLLEGQSVGNGQLLLHGWDLTFASFWTSNALIDAALIAFAGLRTAVLYLGPALDGALAILAGALPRREGRRNWAVVAGTVTVVVLLGFGVAAMEFFFVGHGFHVGTIALLPRCLRRPEKSQRRLGVGRGVVSAIAAGDARRLADGRLRHRAPTSARSAQRPAARRGPGRARQR